MHKTKHEEKRTEILVNKWKVSNAGKEESFSVEREAFSSRLRQRADCSFDSVIRLCDLYFIHRDPGFLNVCLSFLTTFPTFRNGRVIIYIT